MNRTATPTAETQPHALAARIGAAVRTCRLPIDVCEVFIGALATLQAKLMALIARSLLAVDVSAALAAQQTARRGS